MEGSFRLRTLMYIWIIIWSSSLYAQEVFQGENGLVGVKKAGKIVLEAQYQQILSVDNGYLLCKQRESGSQAEQHELESILLLSMENEHLWVDKNNYEPFPFKKEWYYGYYPWEGKAQERLPAKYKSLRPIGYHNLWEVYDGKKYQIWDRSRKKWLSTQSKTPFYTLKKHDPSSGFAYQGENGLYGIVKADGNLATKPIYSQMKRHHDMWLVQGTKGWQFMYPENYQIAGRHTYEDIILEENIEGGILFKQEGKYGLLNEYGDPGLFKAQFEGIKELMPYIYAVKIQNHWGVAHSEVDVNEPYVPFEYDSIVSLEGLEEYIGVYQNGQIGLIVTDTWKVVLEPSLSEVIIPTFEGYYDFFFFKKNNYLGLMDRHSFEIRIEANYHKISPKPSQGKVGAFGYIVEDEYGKQGFISADFQLLLPLEYTKVAVKEAGTRVDVETADGKEGYFSVADGQMHWNGQ